MKPGVEPLRRVRRDHLHREHVAQLVKEGGRVGLGGEIAALVAPIGPGASQPVEDLAGIDLGTVALGFRQLGQFGVVGNRAPRKEGTSFSSTFFRRAGTPALRKYFCAITSEATCDQNWGTSTFSRRKTTEPSGFLISDVVNLKSIPA